MVRMIDAIVMIVYFILNSLTVSAFSMGFGHLLCSFCEGAGQRLRFAEREERIDLLRASGVCAIHSLK